MHRPPPPWTVPSLYLCLAILAISTMDPAPRDSDQRGWLTEPPPALVDPAALQLALHQVPDETPSIQAAAYHAEAAERRALSAQALARQAEGNATTVTIWQRAHGEILEMHAVAAHARLDAQEAQMEAVQARFAAQRAFSAALVARSGLAARRPEWARWAMLEGAHELARAEAAEQRTAEAAERSAVAFWEGARLTGTSARIEAGWSNRDQP